MPITVIIIAILALLVLVVLTLIFTGKIRFFSRSISECQGECLPESECEVPKGECPGEIVQKSTASTRRISQTDEKIVCCIIPKK